MMRVYELNPLVSLWGVIFFTIAYNFLSSAYSTVFMFIHVCINMNEVIKCMNEVCSFMFIDVCIHVCSFLFSVEVIFFTIAFNFLSSAYSTVCMFIHVCIYMNGVIKCMNEVTWNMNGVKRCMNEVLA